MTFFPSTAKAGCASLSRYGLRALPSWQWHGAGKIEIGETGWPTAGSQSNPGGNWTGIPSVDNQKQYSIEYSQYASDPSENPPPFTYLFSGIDEPDKAPEPGDVQGHWGLYNVDDTPKWTVGAPPPNAVPVPGTLLLAGSGLLAMLPGRRGLLMKRKRAE